jgi:HSP20 family protein
MSPQAASVLQPSKTSVPVKQTDTKKLFDRIQKNHDSIAQRAFEIFDNRGRWHGRELEDWLQAESELLHPVQLEMEESENDLTVRAHVPGFSTRELEINAGPRNLTIVGKHEAQEENTKGQTVSSQSCAKGILRVVDLPVEIDSSKVTATLKDGILSLEMPKAARARTVRVAANAA